MKVEFYRHGLGADDATEIGKVVTSAFLTTGRVSHAVESQLCEYFGVPHAVLVNQAGAALGLRMRPWQEAVEEYCRMELVGAR